MLEAMDYTKEQGQSGNNNKQYKEQEKPKLHVLQFAKRGKNNTF